MLRAEGMDSMRGWILEIHRSLQILVHRIVRERGESGALLNETLLAARLRDSNGVLCRTLSPSTSPPNDEWTPFSPPTPTNTDRTPLVVIREIVAAHNPTRADERARIEAAGG